MIWLGLLIGASMGVIVTYIVLNRIWRRVISKLEIYHGAFVKQVSDQLSPKQREAIAIGMEGQYGQINGSDSRTSA